MAHSDRTESTWHVMTWRGMTGMAWRKYIWLQGEQEAARKARKKSEDKESGQRADLLSLTSISHVVCGVVAKVGNDDTDHDFAVHHN